MLNQIQDCEDLILYSISERGILKISQIHSECKKFTYEQVQQAMNNLTKDGLIEYKIEDMGKYSGYVLTDKAKESEQNAEVCALAMGYGEIIQDNKRPIGNGMGYYDEFGGL